MNNSRRNGLRTDDDIDEGLIAEEDILQVVELEPNNSQGMMPRRHINDSKYSILHLKVIFVAVVTG